MEPQITIPEWQGILDDPGLGGLSFQDSVLDNSPITTRAGLYIYLNALLYDWPSFDDDTVATFLSSRYNEDIPSLVSDLILASFDVLANAMYRNERTRSLNIIRSFLVNKLPVFLHSNYAGLIFEPLTVEQCIRQALGRIDPSAFPSFSQMYGFSLLSEARQEFLFACALHQLIQEQSIEEILGDVTMQSLPAGGRYIKDDLVSQCTANSTRIDQLIGELENMEGNAGAIAGAVIEILHTLCTNYDTITLKGLCNTLTRKPTTLDVIMLFSGPSVLLRPLCNILDNWQEHEDQGEYQPVYDEFGSILLLIVIVQHRFMLRHDDMGIEKSDSFVRQFLQNSSASRPLDDLTEHEDKLLGAWIKGLFETEGISDELMSTCKPGEFHLLVATLFDQSLKACQSKILALDTLKGGFEYLLEPFLLPSLISGLAWFADRLWEVNEKSPSINTILLALQALLKPASMSHDSSEIHGAVISVVAKRLKESLTRVQQLHPSRQDISPLLAILNPRFDERPGQSALKELSSWSVTTGGGLLAAVRNTIRALILWSANSSSSNDSSPPTYTHSQMQSSVQILGAKLNFDLLVSEASAQTENPSNEDIAIDIIAVMIFASQDPSTQATKSYKGPTLRLTLYDILQSEFQASVELAQTDLARASMVVRLHRRVEALSGRKQAVPVDTSNFMADVVRNAEGMPTTDIDDVLAEAQNQTAEAQAYLSGENAALLGIA